MGLFDTVKVPCPHCKTFIYFQTKSGPCTMESYTLEDAPADVMENVNRHAPLKCGCGALVEVDIPARKGRLVGEKPTGYGACRECGRPYDPPEKTLLEEKGWKVTTKDPAVIDGTVDVVIWKDR